MLRQADLVVEGSAVLPQPSEDLRVTKRRGPILPNPRIPEHPQQAAGERGLRRGLEDDGATIEGEAHAYRVFGRSARRLRADAPISATAQAAAERDP